MWFSAWILSLSGWFRRVLPIMNFRWHQQCNPVMGAKIWSFRCTTTSHRKWLLFFVRIVLGQCFCWISWKFSWFLSSKTWGRKTGQGLFLGKQSTLAAIFCSMSFFWCWIKLNWVRQNHLGHVTWLNVFWPPGVAEVKNMPLNSVASNESQKEL